MVSIISNPAFSSTDTTGQGIGQALQGISSAFYPQRVDYAGQLAIQNYRDKRAAEGIIGDAQARLADANQDYAQDSPMFSTQQPPPTIDIKDPAALGNAFMVMGYKPGEAMQMVSSLGGGVNSPGVAIGSIPGGGYDKTPEGIRNANDLAINKDASAPALYQDAAGNVAYAPKNAPPVGYQPAPTSQDEVKAGAMRRYLFQPGNLQTSQPGATAPNPANSIAVPGYDGTFTRQQATDAEGAPSPAEWDAAAKPVASASPGDASPPVTTGMLGGDQRIALGLDKQDKADTGEVQNYKFDQQDRQSRGLPAISFSDWNTQKQNAGKGGGDAIIGMDGQPVPPDLTGPELLKAVPSTISNRAVAIQEGRFPVPVAGFAARDPTNKQALAVAMQLEPGLSASDFNARNKMTVDLASKQPNSMGGNNNNLNTMISHVGELSDAGEQLNNFHSGFGSSLLNAGRLGVEQFNQDPHVVHFNGIRDNAVDEIMKLYRGSQGSETEVARRIGNLRADMSPEDLHTALNDVVNLAGGKLAANTHQYNTVMGPAAKAPDFTTPEANATMQAIGDRAQGIATPTAVFGTHYGPSGASSTQSARSGQPAPPPGAPPTAFRYVPGQGFQ